MADTGRLHINCDMGESFGRYTLVDDNALMPYIDACNIACGFHAGDPIVMEQTIQLALRHNIQLGAHPSYPDRQGFGRRPMDIPMKDLSAMIKYQVAAMKGVTQSLGGQIHHVKVHGALYNRASVHEETAMAVARAVLDLDPTIYLYAPYGSIQSDIAKSLGLNVIHEAFIDRRYNNDGTLVSRKKDGALITNSKEAYEQALSIHQRQEVSSTDGKIVPLEAATFCIHGDNPYAQDILAFIHDQQA